jgi:hypothetical protein
MWEIKRVHALRAFNRISRLPVGLKEYYRLRQTDRLVRGAGRREAKVPSEYEKQTKTQMRPSVHQEAKLSVGALRALSKLRAIALRAFGEYSSSVNLLIEDFAHEGALNNPGKFVQGNYKAAFGQIQLWLKRLWARLAVITAVESPLSSRLRRLMLRPKPRMTGGTTALAASVKRKPPSQVKSS